MTTIETLLHVEKMSTIILIPTVLNAELNPICHLLELLRAHHILHVSRIRVNIYIYIYMDKC